MAKASNIWVDEQIAPEYHEMLLTVKVDPGESFDLSGRLEDRSGHNAPEEGIEYVVVGELFFRLPAKDKAHLTPRSFHITSSTGK